MTKNVNSSSGPAEDLIRAFVQMGCAEVHLKTLYEKTLAEMENGIVDVSDEKVRKEWIEKAGCYYAYSKEIGVVPYILGVLLPLLTVFNYWASYRTFKGFQVINHKWINL